MQRVAHLQQCRWIPANRCAAEQRVTRATARAGRPRAECEERDCIVVALRHVQLRAVAREQHADRCTPLTQIGRGRVAQRADHRVAACINHADRVCRSRRREQPRAVGIQEHRGWMSSHVDRLAIAQPRTVRRVHVHLLRAPAGHVHGAIVVHDHTIRVAPRTEPLCHAASGQVDDGERVGQVLGHIQQPAIAAGGDAGRITAAAAAWAGPCTHDDGIAQRQPRRCPVIAIDRVGVAARRVQCATIGSERQPDECRRLIQRLRHGA